MQTVGQRTPLRRAVAGIKSEPAETDDVAEAIDQLLHEVQAARRDLRMTGFCLQQAEALRRIDRTKASLADLVQSGDRKANTRRLCEVTEPHSRLASAGLVSPQA
jgi:hypothetical protein